MELKTIVKQQKGVAGLDLALSVITMIFVIGLLVMIFSLMGAELKEDRYTSTTSSVTNESVTTVNDTGDNLAQYNLRGVSCTMTTCINASSGDIIASTNYTETDCNLAVTGAGSLYNNTDFNCTYSYTWDKDSTTTQAINDTVVALADTPTWFPIVITITFMVVLILLTVMIIRAIRGSGLMTGA